MKHRRLLAGLALMFCLAGSTPTVVYAVNEDGVSISEDSGQDSSNYEQDSGSSQSSSGTRSSRHNNALSEALDEYEPITEENMAKARKFSSPIQAIIGNILGAGILAFVAIVGLVTLADFFYIGVPFLRPYLDGTHGQAQGGTGMGMGMGGYGGMGGMSQQAQPAGRQFVSDEAIYAVKGGAQAQTGSPMGGMGMGGMGGMQSTQQQPKRYIFLTYIKDRAFVLILIGVGVTILTSSVFTRCGLNIAELLFKIMDKVNTGIGNISI